MYDIVYREYSNNMLDLKTKIEEESITIKNKLKSWSGKKKVANFLYWKKVGILNIY